MGGFTNWMEKHFVPVAAKIGSQKHLVAIRDAFIAIMPVTMAGAFATLFNVFVRDIPRQLGADGIVSFFQPFIAVNGNVWWGCLGFFALAFSFSLGYHLSKAYDVNPIAGGMINFAALLSTTSQSHNEGWGGLSWSYTSANGLFTALILGLIVTMIYIKMTQANIIIKMPEGVPPAVSKTFAALIPGVVAIFFAGLVGYLCYSWTGMYLNEVVFSFIQEPSMRAAQSFPIVLLVVLAVQLLWFFGLHGTNLLAPILDGVYKTALLQNTDAFTAGARGLELPHLWSGASFNAYAWMGGAGCTLALIVAILLFSKKDAEKTVAKLSLPMGIFNINEPITFGVPIVLNALYVIPYILIPVLLTTIGYFATAFGLVAPAAVEVPWIVPPVLYAFLTTGMDWRAAVLALINLGIAIVLWSIFVRIANKVED